MSNRLFPVPVCGSGTAEVESLPSYIHRLAYKHGIFVGELLRFVVRQVERDESYCGELPVLPRHIYVHDILRNNKLTRGLLEALEHMTRQSLGGTTIGLFGGPLTMSRGELHAGFRWCPECMAEMMTGGEPYFKLIWQLRAVRACPIHRSPLVEQCEHCECDQTSYIKRWPLGLCQDCGKPLSKRRRKLKAKDLAHSWTDTGRDVQELFGDLEKYGASAISEDGLFRSLDQLFDHYWRQQREEDFYQLLDRDQLLSVVYYNKTLCLNAARKIAFGLGISLYDLLTGNAAQTTQALDFGGFCPLPPSFMDTSGRLSRDHRAVLRRLNRFLSDDVEPMSLKAVARELDVSIGYLEYRFSHHVRRIVDRNHAYQEDLKQQRRRLAQEKALRYFVNGNEGLSPKSRKQAYRMIREESGLPKFLLKRAIEQAYQALNF